MSLVRLLSLVELATTPEALARFVTHTTVSDCILVITLANPMPLRR